MELKRDNLKLFQSESGSISLVVMALFIVSLSSILVITDVAAVAIAKRSLTQATEAAAQRGVRNLDRGAYYRGEFDATTQARNLLGVGPSDPGIPIDCSKALGDVEGALADWSSGPNSLRRVEITNLKINRIECDGFGIQLITQATARLPLVLPFLNLDSFEISSKVSTTNTRAKGFSPFGIRIF
jgi:Flp pilus assembly protein TadG